MPRTDWRLPATYEGLRPLDAPGFAWEFLSRNTAFERDYERLDRASEDGPLSADELNSFARRWGVRFREARTWRRRSPSPVDAVKSAERDPNNSASS
jgi:hypothetical protein